MELRGLANESGIYTCQWNGNSSVNSNIFTVVFETIAESSTGDGTIFYLLAIPVILAITGLGAGIKAYSSRVQQKAKFV